MTAEVHYPDFPPSAGKTAGRGVSPTPTPASPSPPEGLPSGGYAHLKVSSIIEDVARWEVASGYTFWKPGSDEAAEAIANARASLRVAVVAIISEAAKLAQETGLPAEDCIGTNMDTEIAQIIAWLALDLCPPTNDGDAA